MNNVKDIVEYQQCNGCGVCSFIAPEKIRMVDFEQYGIRPIQTEDLSDCEKSKVLDSCPGISLQHDRSSYSSNIKDSLYDMWGPVLEVYEGFANDRVARWSGSSGGLLTALSLFAVDSPKYSGVLHTASSEDDPVKNRTQYSQTPEEVLKASGSRYAPSAPLAGLHNIVGKKNSIVIGKPCDAAALYKLRKLDASVDEAVAVSLSFFCAGVPSTAGNREYIKHELDSENAKLTSLKYRGEGWPGLWKVKAMIDDEAVVKERTYSESWGVLQKYRQWRCYICPDHSGEFADISVGDPWYRPIGDQEIGSSLIVVRTEKGKEFLTQAVEEGYITLTKNDDTLIDRSQPNLIQARGSLWGRLLILNVLGVHTPRFIGYKFFKFWVKLSLGDKKSSILGTAKRVFVRKLLTRVNVDHKS